MPSVRLLKARDRWENEISIAAEQEKLMLKNFHMYKNNTKNLVSRYKAWLKSREMESNINLDLYK